jgi:hypothetical protein
VQTSAAPDVSFQYPESHWEQLESDAVVQVSGCRQLSIWVHSEQTE